MRLEIIDSLDVPAVMAPLRRRDMSLWILPGASVAQISSLFALPWLNVWNAEEDLNVPSIWLEKNSNRLPLIITRPEQDQGLFRASEFVRIYDLTLPSGSDRRRIRNIARLKDKVEGTTGLLCFVGAVSPALEDVLLAKELSPGLTIVLLTDESNDLQTPLSEEEDLNSIFYWSPSTESFSSGCKKITEIAGDPTIISLKDAPGLQVDRGLAEDISEEWTFFNSSITGIPSNITQTEFDAFLNGDEVWQAYAAGAPSRRKTMCYKGAKGYELTNLDFVEEVADKTNALEQADLSPSEQFEQILFFCEGGSGSTTILRQAAMHLASLGFPCLVSKPSPRNFGGRSLEKFIIDTQDRWAKKRKGKGSGTGTIPFCLFIDTDGEKTLGERGLPRALQALGRKVLLVRAMERSQDEIDAAGGIYVLPAEVSSEELVSIGAHLRSFAHKYSLATLPSDDEWRAFHEGISRLSRFSQPSSFGGSLKSPSLFLIGIYPFVKERVSDENSLEQYYYKKWMELEDPNAKEIVRILSSAGVYGLSVPYDALRRHPDIDILKLHSLGKEFQRKLDLLMQWGMAGSTMSGWYLSIRHAAISVLLSRSIDTQEGLFPYSALLPLIKHLSTKEEDIWFAATISYRLGKHFKSNSPSFSLETDTAIQRAARAIFNAIPESVKISSRTVRHHQGRYHLHVLRACCEALKNSMLTTLNSNEVTSIANEEFIKATDFLKMATEVQGDGEPVSYIFNTFATAYFMLADMLKGEKPIGEQSAFEEALDYEDRAIKHDPANGHALFQYVQGILRAVEAFGDSCEPKRIELLARVEFRLVELVRLHQEKRWRNIDPLEAEKQLGGLFQIYLSSISKLQGCTTTNAEFEATHPEAVIFLKVRALIGKFSLEDSYRNEPSASELKELRSQLLAVPRRSPRSDLYLYRLYLSDPEGRLQFKTRLELLEKIKREDPELFLPFRHDEAVLYCQLDQLDIGERKLKEIREYRRFDQTQWFWLNERALLDPKSGPKPREVILEVSDPVDGWALVRNTEIRIKYQPYQFPTMERRQVFRAFIRFTLSGMQAVSEALINHDLAEMGLA